MKIYKIAGRNLWRNRRRTLITSASVFFAVFFALIMRSWQLGTYQHLYRNMIESYTGYIQVQNENFLDNKIIDNVFYAPEGFEDMIMKNKNCEETVPRFESFALASSGNLTKGVMVMGIDPDRESRFSNVRRKLIANSLFPDSGYLKIGVKSALVGKKLADFLKINPGDSLILLGQGYQGTTAAGKYLVSGIVKLPTPDIDNKIVYLPYDVCQELYNANGMLTSIAVSIKNSDDESIDEMISELSPQIESPLRIVGWKEMNKLLINQMEADSKSGAIMILILYMVIAFGIFGTVLMMTAERKREFGVLVSIGMQKTKLSLVVVLEMIYIGLLGIAAGVAAALPFIYYFNAHPVRFTGNMAEMYVQYGIEPVMPFMLPDTYILWQLLTVAVIICIALVYPLRKIRRIKVVDSLKA